ncbi:MAG TPA: DNA polymerase III subunit gamma/tau, partial [Candidatus Limnocylindrales bacterium]|nr:DNA polymerase III subunit gamma/tau [Candidatus Limnocylindrales bacterium]
MAATDVTDPTGQLSSQPTDQPTPHQALYRRWRSQTFGQVVAQDAVIQTLRNAVRLNRLAHGLLFVGPRGTGKTSTARIVAKAVNCLNPIDGEPDDICEPCVAIRDGRALDVVELDAASNNRVDDMRELLPRVYTAPADLRHKVFIIDEVQRIKEGWDVLLKTLEEPPPDVLFIFCTTDPSGIRPAVVSRLQRFTFRPFSEKQIIGKLRRIAEAEGRSITDDALDLIAQRAAGGMRDAESMLDQVVSSGVEEITADTVRDLLGLAEMHSVDRFVAALAGGDPLDGIRLLDELEHDGRDLVAFADQVVARLREQLIEALAESPRAGDRGQRLARAARRLAGLDVNRGAAGGYRLQLELALLDGADSAGAPQVQARPEAPPRAAEQPRAEVKPRPETPPPSAPAGHAPTPPAKEPVAVAVESATPEPVTASPPEESAASSREPAASTPEPVVVATPQAADQSLQDLIAVWPRVVERIAGNPANKPIIAACRPVEVSDATIVLGFPESQAFMRGVAERKRASIEADIGHVLGRPVAV